MSVLIPFAQYQNRCVTVDEVQRGDSGAVCVDCGSNLVARKGSHKIHHFAHKADANCTSRGETVLHRFAKEVLVDPKRSGKQLHLQDLHRPGRYGGVDLIISKGRTEYYIKQIKKFVDVLLEGNLIRPQKRPFPCYLGVEICVTHRKTEEDIAAFRSVPELAVIEMYLSMDNVVEYWKSNPSRPLKSHVVWMLMSGGTETRRWLVTPSEI